ncbi:predicted protein [Postia placenta Mad-698-R]|nr:predicted protein [Postia placenta Mad-698-R]
MSRLEFVVDNLSLAGDLPDPTATRMRLIVNPICATLTEKSRSKAVSEGAVAFHLERWVSARKARVTYGVTCCRQYDNLNEEHRHRHPKTKVWPSGLCMVPDGYLTLLSRGSQVHGNHEVYRDMFVESRKKADLKTVKSIVTCYRGKLANPNWTDVEPEMFSTLCTVHADTSRVQKVKKKGPKGPYFTQTYRVVLLCGLTELKAQISWIENGREMRLPDPSDGGMSSENLRRVIHPASVRGVLRIIREG